MLETLTFIINIAYRMEGGYNKRVKGKSMRLNNCLKYLMLVCMIPFTLYTLNADTFEWELKISVEKANVRLKPDADSPAVYTLLNGTILKSYEKVEEWFRVVIGPDEKGFSVIGYIHPNNVEIIKEKIIKELDFWEEESEYFKGIGLEVRLSGGPAFFYSGDINRGTRGLYDSTADFYSSAGYMLDQRTESFKKGFDVTGDVIYYVKPQLGIGLGIGFMRATGTNFLDVSGKDIPWSAQLGSRLRIDVVPIRLGLYFTLPVHRLFSITFNGGPSLYLTQYSYFFETDWENTNSLFHKANAKNLGFHGGIGLEVSLTQQASFLIEGQGRYAKISNYTGKLILTEYVVSDDFVGYDRSEVKGTLYYLEGEKFPSLVISDEEPSGFTTIRKAVFDFSGFSLRVGVIVKF